MIYQTHVQIANVVLQRLTPTQLLYLSKKEFIRGSNHPDYDLQYRLIKHEFYPSKSTVTDLLQSALSKPMSRYERGFTLGIVAHFFADYMCSFHSNPYFNKKNLATHILYEQRLYAITKNQNVYDRKLFQANSVGDLMDEIEEFIATQMNTQEISHALDFKRAVALVEHMVHFVLDQTVPEKLLQKGINNSLRVAIFTDTYYPQINGVSNTIYHYMKYLKQENIPYVLVCPKYDAYMQEKEEGYEIIRVPSISFPFYREAKVGLPNRRKLYNNLDDFTPTVIHIMTEFTIGHAGLSYSQKRKIPVATNYSTNFSTYLSFLGLSLFKKPLESHLNHFHKQGVVTTVPSHQTKKDLLENGLSNVEIFGRGIHTNQFSPNHRRDSFRERFHEDPFIYLYVGRISAEKQLDLALAAFEQIHFHHHEAVFLVVGDGPKRSHYEQAFPSAIFLGYKTGKELAKIYASSDVFVFPSATETFGNVVLEAMSSGLPVITANKGGVLENVKHLVNGLIAQEQTELAYFELMSSYYHDRPRVRESRNQALRHARTRNWSTVFKQQIKLLRELSEA
jgi:glycosyltransferase involved in cell wall biosynthesis